MAEKITQPKRKRPKFLRVEWHKKIKLGSTVKKKRKWKKAIGRHNKIRLGRRGRQQRPKIGWSESRETRNLVRGFKTILVENKQGLLNVQKDEAVVISGKVGGKKRAEIIAEANKMKLKILNNYPGEKK